jgi:asparagine synthase (glutamine-hydrolysing)
MCGFAGVVYEDHERPVDSAMLDRTGALLTHRGPDDSGTWQGPGAGMVHRRLSILDLSAAGHQPFSVADERYVLAYNGEVYNFREIRHDLEAAGHRFHTTCDTEVVAQALAQWGPSALERFNGMFALAFYDTTSRSLLLARDRLGIKPLFYSVQPEGVYYASELRALKHGFELPVAVSRAALDAYFTYLYIPAPETVYEGVQQVTPATVIQWGGGACETRRYWEPTWRPTAKVTLPEAAEAVRHHVEESVRLRRLSDVPLGAFLSGGVDSTAVVATLASQSTEPVRTYTIGFDDAQADELAFARVAADRFGTDHTEAILKPDMIELLPKIQRHFGQPFADSSALPMWLVSQIARETVTVALSGDGGDELFAGYTWAHMHHRVNQYRRIAPSVRMTIDALLKIFPGRPFFNRVRRFSGDSFVSDVEGFRRRQTCLDAGRRERLLNCEGRAPDRFGDWAKLADQLSPDERMLFIDLQHYLPNDILTKVDGMSMAHGLEARVPLLDHHLVAYAGTLPFDLKYRGGVSKRVLKTAFREDFPPQLMQQRKQGFSLPIHRWFREGLGDHFQERVLGANAPVRDWIHAGEAEALLNAHKAGRENWGHALWAILSLAVWLEDAG